MNGKRKNGLAKAAVASALGIGAIGFGLRAAPAVAQAVAGLRSSGGGSGAPPIAAMDAATGTATARTAFLVTNPSNSQAAVAQNIAYLQKDGTYTGKREYAYYGYVKVQATVKNGTLTNVRVVEYPSDNRRSQYINDIALPYLIQEATDAQSYKVDFISGATFTSVAFARSLREALAQAGS